MSDQLRSSVAIARLLDSEGFSDHVANCVERYWKRNVLAVHKKNRVERTERAFEESVIPKLSDADKIILGKFIGLHKKMSFDAGLRIGLTAFHKLHGNHADDDH